ncbi:MAG TPA: hypothetical protein VGF76_15955, partial [Polyangiaceae bacterium]
RTGAVMGTPYYMAPEQAKGAKDMDHRVDLYAAGVILYESVTGEVPFNADTFNELLFKIVLEEPRPVQQLAPDIDPGFAAIINKAMAREPAVRFQTAKEFQLALEHWANNAGTELANALRMAASPPRPGSIADGAGQFARQTPNPALGTGTPGAWSNTGGVSAVQAPPKKSNAALFAVLGVVAVLVVGGGAAAMRALSKAPPPSVAAAADHSAADEKAKTDALVVAAKAQQAQDDSQAEAAKTVDDARKASADHVQAEANAAASAAEAAATKPKASVARAPAAHPAVAAAAPKAVPAAAAPAAAPASTGRKIRTSL